MVTSFNLRGHRTRYWFNYWYKDKTEISLAISIINQLLNLVIYVVNGQTTIDLVYCFLCTSLGNDNRFVETIWSTAMAREVPREALSRVSSFDAMGTMLLRPVGLAIAGPLSMAIGISTTLYGLAIFSALFILGMLALPAMRNMQIAEDRVDK